MAKPSQDQPRTLWSRLAARWKPARKDQTDEAPAPARPASPPDASSKAVAARAEDQPVSPPPATREQALWQPLIDPGAVFGEVWRSKRLIVEPRPRYDRHAAHVSTGSAAPVQDFQPICDRAFLNPSADRIQLDRQKPKPYPVGSYHQEQNELRWTEEGRMAGHQRDPDPVGEPDAESLDDLRAGLRECRAAIEQLTRQRAGRSRFGT